MQRSVPIYDSEISFARILKVRPETLRRYIELKIVTPDALTTSNRCLFLADPASAERHRASIRAYRIRQDRASQNLKDLAHV